MEFKRHFTPEDVEALFDASFCLPDDFLFGVSCSGYKTEGGFNGPGEPLNNWVGLERSGKVERSGEAIGFWKEYPEQVELAGSIGLNAFRIGVEWARVQPATTPSPGKVPPFDQSAIEGYSNIIALLQKSGLEPIVTLYHFTHPEWLGEDFWLASEKMELFEQFAREFANEVNLFLIEKHGERPVKMWLTMNEPNAMAYKVHKGMVEARRDGATRDVFLQAHLFEALRALKDGVPLTGYFAWTLVDDYEWGSYASRYGLYTVDRTRTPVKIGQRDAWGLDAGRVYSDLITALRSGDREVLVETFTKDYV